MKKVLAWVLCLMLTLGMVSVASAEFAPVNKDDLKVGFVFIGDVSDKGYTYAHYQGLLDMQQNLGLSDDQILIKTKVRTTWLNWPTSIPRSSSPIAPAT